MSSLITPLLWSFLPSQLAHLAIPYLTSFLPDMFPPSPRGSPTYARNYKLAFTGIICLWLAYTFIYDSDASSSSYAEVARGDWYTLLGVERDADDDALRKAFRSLSRLHHPDRAGSNNDEVFIRIRQAYEVLSDPVRRYAYDRFGPQILGWKAGSVREYMHIGLSRASGFYLVSGGIMAALFLLGRAKHGAYWRHTLFVLLLLSELKLILSPTSQFTPSTSPLSLASNYVTSQPQFKLINLLHKISTTLSVAITQLAGVWAEPTTSDSGGNEEEWRRVFMALRSLEAETVTNLQNELVPLLTSTSDPKGLEQLIQKGMADVLVERTLASHPHIRPAWLAATSPNTISSPSAPVPYPKAHHRLSSGGFSNKDTNLARSIPLPPSPPPSPRLPWRIIPNTGRIPI